MKTKTSTLCIIGNRREGAWKMKCIEDADDVRGMAYDFVIWVRTPNAVEYRTVTAGLKTSLVGQQFWICRRPQ